MLNWWFRTAEMEDVGILLRDGSSFFGILEVCHRILLVALSGLMTANLTITLSHSGTFQIVGALQNSIFSELLLNTEHGRLQGFLSFQLAGVGEQVDLQDALILDHPVGGYCYSPHS